MQATDPAELSAVELLSAYRARTLSPVEATRAVLDRIDRLNPKLNAWCVVDAESALASARESEARWQRGAASGTLDGVPVSVKDLVLAKGWPTLRGSRTADPAGPWDTDGPATARLREAGAVLLGKTTTPEYGWKGTTDSPLTGITRNPWNTDLTPGGSSGGAGAAVASGMGPLGVGTDGGGSIRIPSAMCGLVGLKGHFGRVPAWPPSVMGNLAHVGPMARTVADCALMFDVMTRPDPRDWFALPPHGMDWTQGLDKGVKGLRIAYSPRLGYVPWVQPEVEAAVARAAKTFASMGAIVEEVDPGIPDCAAAFTTIWFAGARQAFFRLPAEKFALIDPGLQRVVKDAERTTVADYLDAQNLRVQLGEAMRRFNQTYDLLLTPTLATLPFAVGRLAPELPADAPAEIANGRDWSGWTPFTFPFNFSQQPAIAVPCGWTTNGLPLSLQLVAPAYREDLALRGAAAFEAAGGVERRWPDLRADPIR